jgi:ABC-2 type transport system permease protein
VARPTSPGPLSRTAGLLASRANWQRTGSFGFTELRVQGHESLALATTSIVQTVFIIFVWLLNPALLPYALVGSVIFSVFRIGEGVLNEAAYIRIDHRLTELYHASPLQPESYFLGMAAGMMTAFLPPVIVLGVIAYWIHPMTPAVLLLFVACLFATWVFAASLGYILSTLFRDSRAIWPYSSILYNAFGVLPPVFYPLATWRAAAPGFLQPLALLMPPSASAALVTWAEGLPLTSLSSAQVVTAGLSLAVETLAVFLFAMYWARRAATEV